MQEGDKVTFSNFTEVQKNTFVLRIPLDSSSFLKSVFLEMVPFWDIM